MTTKRIVLLILYSVSLTNLAFLELYFIVDGASVVTHLVTLVEILALSMSIPIVFGGIVESMKLEYGPDWSVTRAE